MATCTSVTVEKSSQSGKFSVTAPSTAKAQYRVVFDAIGASLWEVITASGGGGTVPAFGAALGNLICLTKSAAQQKEDNRQWLVEVEFGVPTPGVEPPPETLDEDGSRWAIDITIDTVSVPYELQRDVHGYPMINSSGTQVTGIMGSFDDEEITISFTTNVMDWAGIDACYAANGSGRVNTDTVYLVVNGETREYAVGTLKFEGYRLAATLDASGAQYWRMVLKLRWRACGWNVPAADMGLYRHDTDLGAVPICDEMANPVTSPVALNGSGNVATVGSPILILPQDKYGGLTEENRGKGFQVTDGVDMGINLLWGLAT